MRLKEHYRLFRIWQKSPIQYKSKKEGIHHCANCGHDFEGNYCPICRQEAGDGRISWNWVWQSIMNLWGMDSRSMPYSLVQLMLRPGYFIGDFISGRRQVSYPPVSMLFGVAVVYAILSQLFGFKAEPVTPDKDNMELFVAAYNWIRTNPAWGTMAMTMFLTIPTWFFFRFAPLHPRHSFPEGVFIQILMSSLMLICLLIDKIHSIFIILIPFYYYITYRQLFGYRFWGTLWRLMLAFVVWIFALLMLIVSAIIFTDPESLKEEGSNVFLFILFVIFTFLVPIVVLLFLGYLIGKRTEKKRLQRTDVQPQPESASPELVK